jgi:hypothetical protein
VQVDVTGKSADDVANEIISHLGDISDEDSGGDDGGGDSSSGRVIILQGLSGTGKGTTVAKLESKLPNVVCWSNGNLFRSLTLLAVEMCEQVGGQRAGLFCLALCLSLPFFLSAVRAPHFPLCV